MHQFGALETNLALKNYNLGISEKLYDFSERHMVYGSVRSAFLNNEINEKGFNLNVSGGGHYYMSQNYLTNGLGAINEYELLFENNENNIDILNIKNKNTTTTLYDTTEFNYDLDNKEQIIQNIKSHISTYGAVYACIYGTGVETSDYYNNDTGAIYVDDTSKLINHSVLIIGWDDNYSRNNFSESHKPQYDGAWIIRNTWGDKSEVFLDEIKKINFESNEETYIQKGYNDYTELPDEQFIKLLTDNGFIQSQENDRKYIYKIGDNGYMYVSYDDVNIYSQLWAVKKAVDEKDYDKIYQNDLLGFSQAITLSIPIEKGYIANVFKRDTLNSENIDKISVYTIQKWKNCKVYINPKNADKSKENLQEVKLKYGDTIDIDVGYHMIEFANPIQVNGNEFVVIVEFETNDNPIISLESKTQNGWEYAIYNEGESFYTINEGFEQNMWQDIALMNTENLRGNVLIKAFTEKSLNNENVKLSNIYITKQPNKTTYTEGEDFDSTGMEVTAIYSDGSKKIVNNYVIEDGNSLNAKKEFVLIRYTENEITVTTQIPIIVSVVGNNNSNDKLPVSSNFENANAVYTKIEADTEKNIYNLSVKISNIKIGDTDNKYTYSYCILGTSNTLEDKDEYWINIDQNNIRKENDGTYTINIDINWNEIKNANELLNTDNLYIHIKEIAEINNKSIQSVNALKINSNERTQLTTNSEQAQNNNLNSSNDDTVSNKILPRTGKISLISIVITLIGIGAFSYIRYKNIEK